MKWNLAIRSFLFIGAVTMLIMSSHYYWQDSSGILGGKEISRQLLYRIVFFCHITGGLIAILVGPFQFIKKVIRLKWVHKLIGYFYVIAVLLSSISGLIIAQYAMGGIITRIGFSVLSIIWFITIVFAIKKIRSGDVENHKKLMKVNYALTFSAITQRTILLFSFIPGFHFMIIYQLSSWLSWIINLLLILILFKREKNANTKNFDYINAPKYTKSQ